MTDTRFAVSLQAEKSSSVLTVNEPLMETKLAEEFEAACQKLVDTGQENMAIDVRRVESIQSCLIGEVAKTKVIATEAGHRFQLIANQKMHDLFRMILGDLVDIKVE